MDSSETPSNLESEKQLVERAKTSSEAFSILYEQNYSKIFSYSLKRVADVDIAKDITSETFFKALKNIKKFKWQNISFSSWLYRIASNETANHFRRKRIIPMENIKDPQSPLSTDSEALEAERILQEKKDFICLHKNISKLPRIYQEVIVLKFFEKKSIKETCEILGKKEGTIKSLIHRALEKLSNETI